MYLELYINEYMTYKHAFEIARDMALHHRNGRLVVFDKMSVTEHLEALILSDELGKETDRMSEKLYLSNVRTLLNRLEEETEGFRNRFDDILSVMIEETSAKLDALNRKK